MDSDLPAYEVHKIDELTFQFTTESGDIYKCYFLSYSPYFAAYPDIAPNVYGFNLDLVSGPIRHKGIDRRIAFTAVNIVADFLSSKINAVVYVCDPSDGRDVACFKKFKSWYYYSEHFSHNIFQVSLDTSLDDMIIHSALLVHKANPLKNRFIEAFLALNDDNK